MARRTRSTQSPASVFPDWPVQQIALGSEPSDIEPAALACEVAHRIRTARAQEGLTRVELGRRAGISEFTILKVEAGQVWPDLHTVGRLIEALGIICSTSKRPGKLGKPSASSGSLQARRSHSAIARSTTTFG